MEKKQRIVIALGGNALGNTLPEQMTAVKITAKAIVDLIEEGCEVVVVHGNGPQVGMINNAMAALSREDPNQPNTPLSVCVAMSQAYIGYDLQNALREELLNRDIAVSYTHLMNRASLFTRRFETVCKGNLFFHLSGRKRFYRLHMMLIGDGILCQSADFIHVNALKFRMFLFSLLCQLNQSLISARF